MALTPQDLWSPSAFVMALKKAVQEIKIRGEGFFESHLREALGLTPEITRFDILTFEGTVGTSTLTQPNNVRLNPEFDYECFAFGGYMANPSAQLTTNPTNITQVYFNIREAGRNFDIFSTDINLAALYNTSGSIGKLEFPRGLYLFRGGADINLTFKMPTQASWSGANSSVGVYLMMNGIRKR